jgi:hypothetical protein
MVRLKMRELSSRKPFLVHGDVGAGEPAGGDDAVGALGDSRRVVRIRRVGWRRRHRRSRSSRRWAALAPRITAPPLPTRSGSSITRICVKVVGNLAGDHGCVVGHS